MAAREIPCSPAACPASEWGVPDGLSHEAGKSVEQRPLRLKDSLPSFAQAEELDAVDLWEGLNEARTRRPLEFERAGLKPAELFGLRVVIADGERHDPFSGLDSHSIPIILCPHCGLNLFQNNLIRMRKLIIKHNK